MSRAEAVFAAVLAFLAGISIGACINRAAPTPAPTRLIAPTNLTATPRTSAPPVNRSFARLPIGPTDHPTPVVGRTQPSPSAPLPRSVATQRPAAADPSAAAGPDVVLPPDWHRLAVCESGDQPHNRQNPRYRGWFQIGYVEWRTYGGVGRDPADATPAEQYRVALRMYAARGWEPWASSEHCTGLR